MIGILLTIHLLDDRDQGTDCERSSDRRFKPFQRYETINSDMFSEPSTGSMDGIPISPRKLFEPM